MTNTVKVTSRVAPLGVWQDIPSDSINSAIIVFEFADDWADLVCTAQFAQGNKTYNQLIVDNQCVVPVELHAGEFKLSVFGAKTDGTAYRSTTVPLVKDVIQSGFDGEGETPIPPTPDLYAQLIEEFANSGVHSLNGIKGDMSLVAGDNTAVSVDTDNKEISIDVTVDSALSDVSENAVQNKVVKAALDGKLDLSGGTMTGDIDLNGNNINNVNEIVFDRDSIGNTPEIYCADPSDRIAIKNVLTPQNDYWAANKKYVDDADALNEKLANKVTSISAASTDTEYPSALAVYTAIQNALVVDTEEVIP